MKKEHPKYNPQVHHRRSIRLKGYDYSQQGLYYITICCKQKECFFGKIIDGKMLLNDGGKVAETCWLAIPDHFPMAILHNHVVMPNHVHGIIEIENLFKKGDMNAVDEVENFLPIQYQQNDYQKAIPQSIGSMVKGFKIGVTKWFRTHTNIHDVWQRNYYEHIIRDENSYDEISHYILNNPENWTKDQFYKY